MTKNEIILARYNKYIEACKKRCEDADVSLGRNRVAKIKSACRSKIVWEENPVGTMAKLNLWWLLIYTTRITDLIPDGVKLYNRF
jgi:hypothetical protein